MISAIIPKGVAYDFPCLSIVVIIKPLDIFKNEDFRITFFYNARKFSK